ncbi:MAG: DUF559 domain-containing protein [Phycisphaeraceae bacterium]|nr:DUF559 domain-containing protein [Phycisphaeraceae bacterium]
MLYEHKLVIELDGDSHRGRADYDAKRQADIEALEYRVLRIANDDVIADVDLVLAAIARACGIELNA